MAERLNELTRHYAAFRAQKNPETLIYLEGAYYLNPEVKDLAFETLARSIDILGMNEEELVEHAARFGLKTDKEDLASILEALNCLLTRYPAKGIVMHTKDYSMYYGRSCRAWISRRAWRWGTSCPAPGRAPAGTARGRTAWKR